MKSNVFEEAPELKCSVCKKHLEEAPENALIIGIKDLRSGFFKSVQACCKGECEKRIRDALRQDEKIFVLELSDLMNPNLFIRHLMNRLGEFYSMDAERSEEAFEDYKSIISGIYPYIARSMSKEEIMEAKQKEIVL